MKNSVSLFFLIFLVNSLFAQENNLSLEQKALFFNEEHNHHSHKGGSRATHHADFDVHFVDLKMNVTPGVVYFEGSAYTEFSVLQSGLDSITYDFSDDDSLHVDSVFVDGVKTTSYKRANDLLIIKPNTPLARGSNHNTEVFYSGFPWNIPGGYVNSSVYGNFQNKTPIFWTKSEPYGAKYWWPSKADLEDKIDSIDIQLTYPKIYKGIANGMLVSEVINGQYKISSFKHRYPIVSYLVATAVADYRHVVDTINYRGKKTIMEEFVYKQDTSFGPQIVSKLHLQKSFALFDSILGEYPFQKERYGHAQFTRGGAMEHQTISFMNNLTEDLVAHELAHQWYGNKVTCKSWADIWINEGFASYLTALTHEQGFGSQNWERWKEQTINYVCSRPEGSVYIYDTTSFMTIFNYRTVYQKGAYLLHMLRWQCGEKAFFEAIKNIMNDPKLSYEFASLESIKEHFEQTSGKDLTEFFKDWYYGEGYPTYALNWRIVADRIEFVLDQKQSHHTVSFFEAKMPVVVYYQGKQRTYVLNNTKQGEHFSFSFGAMPDSVKLDPNFWILTPLRHQVYEGNHINLSNEELENETSIFIFPNPSNEFVQIDLGVPTEETKQVRIVSNLGQEVFRSIIPIGVVRKKFEPKLISGSYQIQVIDKNGGIKTQPLIVY